MLRTLASCAILVFAVACTSAEKAADTSSATAAPVDSAARNAAAHEAHANYVRAINSNNIDSLMSMMTEDVVFLAANEQPLVGKTQVRTWANLYYQEFKTHWDKPVQEFIVSGDYAFERYSYTVTDTPVAGGRVSVGTGWGLAVYHREADGVWRVSRDAFGPDQPPSGK